MLLLLSLLLLLLLLLPLVVVVSIQEEEEKEKEEEECVLNIVSTVCENEQERTGRKMGSVGGAVAADKENVEQLLRPVSRRSRGREQQGMVAPNHAKRHPRHDLITTTTTNVNHACVRYDAPLNVL
jgi:hypothetical protein